MLNAVISIIFNIKFFEMLIHHLFHSINTYSFIPASFWISLPVHTITVSLEIELVQRLKNEQSHENGPKITDYDNIVIELHK